MKRTPLRRIGKVGRSLEKLRLLALAIWYRRAAKLGHFVADNPSRRVVYVKCSTCDRWGMIEKQGGELYRGLALVVGHGKSKSTTPERRTDLANVGPLCGRCNSRMETDRELELRFQTILIADEVRRS